MCVCVCVCLCVWVCVCVCRKSGLRCSSRRTTRMEASAAGALLAAPSNALAEKETLMPASSAPAATSKRAPAVVMNLLQLVLSTCKIAWL